MAKHSTSKGFTIIELMIATTIFGVLLLILTGGIIFIGRQYQKGVSNTRAQNTARLVVQQISQPIQFSGAIPVIGTPTVFTVNGTFTANTICIGQVRYTYALDRRLKTAITHSQATREIKHVLWRDTFKGDTATCPAVDLTHPDPSNLNADPATNGFNGEELIPNAMRLSELIVQPYGISNRIWTIKVGVLYGQDEDIERDNAGNITGCVAATLGGSFCGQSVLETSAYRRIN